MPYNLDVIIFSLNEYPMRDFIKNLIHNGIVHPMLPFLPDKIADELHKVNGEWAYNEIIIDNLHDFNIFVQWRTHDNFGDVYINTLPNGTINISDELIDKELLRKILYRAIDKILK